MIVDVLLFLMSLTVWGFTVYGFWIGAPKVAHAFMRGVDRVDAWIKRRD